MSRYKKFYEAGKIIQRAKVYSMAEVIEIGFQDLQDAELQKDLQYDMEESYATQN